MKTTIAITLLLGANLTTADVVFSQKTTYLLSDVHLSDGDSVSAEPSKYWTGIQITRNGQGCEIELRELTSAGHQSLETSATINDQISVKRFDLACHSFLTIAERKALEIGLQSVAQNP
jgi:hypothetical protein